VTGSTVATAGAGEVLFVTDTVWERRGTEIMSIAPGIGIVRLEGRSPVSTDDVARITLAYFSNDAWPDRTGDFLGVCLAAERLRWVQSFSAGSDHPVFTRFAERGIRVDFGVGTSAASIAQTAMMYLLALVRDLPEFTAAQQAHLWEPRHTRDLGDLTIGVLGLGSIGAEVARLATAFGARVIGVRRSPSGDEPCETWPAERRDELLGLVDAVVLCTPLTEQTRRSIGADEFAAMRPGTLFVNVGRGECVDEDALVAALASGHLGGAGLDVFVTEPLPADSPLWDMPRVIITPHASGITDRTARSAEDLFLRNLEQTLTEAVASPDIRP
jgi:phosphoglycerate dehydrogenase-like enzyme